MTTYNKQSAVSGQRSLGQSSHPYIHYTVAFVLFILTFLSLYLTIDDIGVVWDEAYLCDDASKLYIEWFSKAIRDIKRGSLDFTSNDVIDRYFGAVIEGGKINWHPPFGRMLSGVTWKLFKDRIGELNAFRLSPILLFSLEVSILYLFISNYFGYITGIFASLTLLLMPRVFGDAHLFALDTPIAFMCFLTAYSFYKGIDKKKWAIITGIIWGLALNTKVHAFFMPIPLFLWAVSLKKRYLNNLIAMLLISPIVYLISWPWLWHDTINHIFGYSVGMGDVVVKPFNHPVDYMGIVYSGRTPPWHYPFIMILITTPPFTLLFSIAAVFKTFFTKSIAMKQIRDISILFILCMAVFLILFALPFTPKYDGVRLLSPVFPFLAGIASVGFYSISMQHIKREFYIYLICFISLTFSLISLVKIHPFESSYYNIFIGGLRGASSKGFDVTYYGDPLNKGVINFMNERLSDYKGSGLVPRFDYRGGPFREQVIFYTDIGWLSEKFLQNQYHLWDKNYKGRYDYYILYNRKSTFDEKAWFYFKNLDPVYSVNIEGTPLLNIYSTPEGIKNHVKPKYPNNGLSGYYYANMKFIEGDAIDEKSALLKRLDQLPGFSNKYSFLDEDMLQSLKRLSVYWRGFIKISDDGEYGFSVFTDGDGSISIDGETVVNHTRIKKERFGEGEKFLKKGYHFIEIKYARNSDSAYFYPLFRKGKDKYQIITPETLFPLKL